MKEHHTSFVRSAGLVSLMTLASRITGFLREATFSQFFGLGRVWDAYSIAFQIPNLSRYLFGEGALSASFIPVLTERFHQDGREAARQLTGGVLMLLATVLTGLTVLGEVGVLTAYYFHPTIKLSLTAIMLPYMIFICSTALLGGAHNVLGRFGIPAALPILFNVFLITGAWTGHFWVGGNPNQHAYVIGGFLLLSGVTQLFIQWQTLRRVDFGPRMIWNPLHPDIRRIVTNMAPMMLGLAAVQINTVSDRIIADIFVPGNGGASALYYSGMPYQLPIGIFGVAIATAIFPQLSRLASGNDREGFALTLQHGIRLAFFVGIPASVGLCTLRVPMVRFFYEQGSFHYEDSLRVARVVACYGMGVWAYIAQQIIVRGYYAKQEIRTPMRAATSMVVLNLILNLILVQWMNESGVALATAICAALQMVILSRRFASKTGQSLDWNPIVKSLIRIVIASALMGVVVVVLNHVIGEWGGQGSGLMSRKLHLFVQLVILGGGGAGVFFVMARLLGCEELSYLRKTGSEPATSLPSDAI